MDSRLRGNDGPCALFVIPAQAGIQWEGIDGMEFLAESFPRRRESST
ncbi:hypothetical protein MNBD_DELTA04-626 [hydrothermal vent metagenome]|uniref:Uncharacterized protein n=1 Tax=hydrothermal vent metagenome TaxID=652676 RepID=A0A3B0VT86_9ZZZZ